jgi:hypothetical protein
VVTAGQIKPISAAPALHNERERASIAARVW